MGNEVNLRNNVTASTYVRLLEFTPQANVVLCQVELREQILKAKRAYKAKLVGNVDANNLGSVSSNMKTSVVFWPPEGQKTTAVFA